MKLPPSDTCSKCGGAVDTTLLGGVCPRCLLGDVLSAPDGGNPPGFDGHELLGEIARGGMGVVYRAREFEPDRLVALKTLRSTSLDSPEALARFRIEVEVMATLDHPAILPVYRCGSVDGIPFFTMKLAEGGTLAEAMERYSGQWREIAELMARISDAVRHAHERAVLHRDLKPANILFDSAGQAYVSDFGIARLADSQNAGLTMTISMIGTPHYLAPEIAAASAKAASVSSDVWSLGVILYELLTRQKPFQGQSVAQVLRALEIGEPIAPRRLRSDVPRDLEVITLKALAAEPARRYASAQAFAEDLRAWLGDRPISARAVPRHERAWLWARRNPRLAGTAALLILALFATAAALGWGYVRVKEENARVVALQAGERVRLRESFVNQARAGRVAHEMGWRAAGLKALREAYAIQPGEDVRDEAVAHLAGFDLELKRRYEREILPSRSMELYAQVESKTEVRVHRMSDDAELFRLSPLSIKVPPRLEFDPRGRWLAVNAVDGARVYSMDDQRELAHWPGADMQRASEDGEFLSVREKDRWVLRRSSDWSEAGQAPLDRNAYIQYRPLPASQPLHAGRLPRGLKITDWRTGAILRSIELTGSPTSYDWVGDYLTVNFGNNLGQAYDLRRERSVMLPQLPGPGQFFANSNSVFMLSTAGENVTKLWHLPTGTALVKARGFMVRTFGTDDRRFVTTDSVTGRVVHPSCVRLLPEHQLVFALVTTSKTMELSPDGRLLLIHDRDRLAVHDISTGKLLAYRAQRSMIFCSGFSPDGSQLIVVHATGITVLKLVRREARLVLVPEREVSLPEAGKIVDTLILPGGVGVFIRFESGGVFEWRTQSGEWLRRTELTKAPNNFFTADFFAVSPDGRWIAGIPPFLPLVYEAGKMNVRRRLGPPPQTAQQERFGRVSFSPDSRRLVFMDRRYRWNVYDAPDWQQVASSGDSAIGAGLSSLGMALEAAWSPDGSWFAVVYDGTDIHLVETGTWRTMARLRGPLEMPVTCMGVTANGSSLVVQRRDLSVEIWDLRKLEDEMRELGIDLRLPPAVTPPPSPPGLAGPFEEVALPPLTLKEQQTAK